MTTRREFIKGALVGASLAITHACPGQPRPAREMDANALRAFRARLRGRVIRPVDPEYDSVRRVAWWNPATAKRPALLVQCQSESDVALSLEFARRQGLAVAVRSGGHSYLGWGISDGLVIDLTRMNDIVVDPVRRTANVGAGVVAGALVAAAVKHGLAPILGECDTVGAGLALGGGLGWLAGKHGATCDNVLSARLITAGVDALTVAEASHEDLYWAIRGGGGNFGVVTRFEHRLHPAGTVVAGGFAYPAREGRAVIQFFRDFMSEAPDELQALAYLTSAGGGTLMTLFVHSGELDAGERLLEQFRKFRTPQRDWLQRRPYPEVYTMPPYSDPPSGPPCGFHEIRGTYIEHLSDDAIDVILTRFAAPPPACELGFDLDHFMHGEVCRVAPDATAFELRGRGAIHLAFGAEWDSPERSAPCIAWLDETWKLLQPYSGGRVYTNFASVEGQKAAEAAYGRNYSRLASIKRRYDPDNVFQRNLNIAPG